jgi:hypothetical protein
MKRIISAFAFTIVLAATTAAQAAEEDQDWYEWYEQQSAQAAAEEAQQYAQYYEATSPDQQIASNIQDGGAGAGDAYTNPANDPYAYDEAPEQTQEQTTPGAEEPAWIWSGEDASQEQQPEDASQEQQSE